jgi:PAS domain-containing protein
MVGQVQAAIVRIAAATGGNDSDPTVTLIVGLIALTGALSAALIAAWSAGRRQVRQLDANADRQRDELRHDRTLVDLQELRAVFDDAAANLSAAARAMARAHQVWKERAVGDTDMTAMRDAEEALGGSAERIRIRLGDGKATEAYRAAADKFSEAVRLIEPKTEPTSREERAAETDRIKREFETLRNQFFSEAHRVVGSQLATPIR